MKNELGIEICCENCMLRDYGTCEFTPCESNNDKGYFMPSTPALRARIEELQTGKDVCPYCGGKLALESMQASFYKQESEIAKVTAECDKLKAVVFTKTEAEGILNTIRKLELSYGFKRTAICEAVILKLEKVIKLESEAGE